MESSTTPRQYETPRRPYSPLRIARHGLGLTQEQLANAAGISRQRVIELEAGKGRPRRVTAVALASVLQVEVSDLWPELNDNYKKESDK